MDTLEGISEDYMNSIILEYIQSEVCSEMS